jgi:hypothetical protein
MNWFAALDIYCERLAPGLLAEPLNAASNIAYLVAAGLIWRQCRDDADARRSAVLIALVGLGSLTFHTVAQVWASWLDIGFILIFMLFCLYRLLRRAFGLAPGWAATALVLFIVADKLLQQVFAGPALYGSQMYLAALSALWLMAAVARTRRLAAAPYLLAAAACFVVSIVLRTFDLPGCNVWPWGTHFGWHLLTGLVLYLLARALVAMPIQERSTQRSG